jgi:hypothetical protein
MEPVGQEQSSNLYTMFPHPDVHWSPSTVSRTIWVQLLSVILPSAARSLKLSLSFGLSDLFVRTVQCVLWSENMDDEEERTSSAYFWKENI